MIKQLPDLRLVIIFCLLMGILGACQQPSGESSAEESPALSLKEEVAYELEKTLLGAWYPRTIDSLHGGFLTNFAYDWQPLENQDKMIVTQARHLWTLSKVAALYPEEPLYAEAARHAYDFLTGKMWDEQFGGFYWLVSRAGEPILDDPNNQLKRVYGNAFAIYGLAAYYDLTEDEEVLKKAQLAFRWMDEHAHDPELLGYISTLNREGAPIDSSMFAENYPMESYFYKDQNTSIHVLEALTELYHVWPDDTLEARLREMFHLVRDSMVTDKGYLRLFFYDDWTPISYQDSAQEVRKAKYGIDHVSFGHDIETAYLLLEASEALEEYEYEQTLQKARQMVDHTLRWGFDPGISGIYDRGYYVDGQDSVEIIFDHKNWWSQSEGLNSLYLFSTLFPEDERYRREFDRLWNYTKNYLIDHEHGGWYPNGLDTDPEAAKSRKAQAWKGNYHNGRALMNLLKMMELEKEAL
ncbi:MAG: AGE family epimerase/isomerase [Cyclobacteriaceae bacterium]